MSNVKIKKIYRKYTEDEDTVIIQNIQKYPLNLEHAFQEASLILKDRTNKGIALRYYSKLRIRNTNTMVSIEGGICSTNGRKNLKRENGKLEDSVHMKPLKSLILTYLKLNIAEQKEFYDILKVLQ